MLNQYDFELNYPTLSCGPAPAPGACYRFGRHLDANLDFTLNKDLDGHARGLTGSLALGLRYRFGGLRQHLSRFPFW